MQVTQIKKSVNISLLIILLFVLLSNCGLTQRRYNISPFSYGGYVSLNLPKYTTDFQKLQGVPNCCPKFTSGEGTGFDLGGIFQYRLFAYNYFRIKAGLNFLYSKLQSDETMWIVLNENLYSGVIRHEILTDFLFINIEPSYKFSTPVGLSFLAGLNFALNIGDNFRQKEFIIDPSSEGTFENGLRTRNAFEGDINGTSTFLLLPFISVEYDLPLNSLETIIFSPSFSFYYGANSLLKEEEWKIFYFSFGANIRFSTYSEGASPIKPGN